MSRLFSGMNTEKDIALISPDSFRFHGTMKALWYKLLRLINPAPKEWLDRMEGNAAIDRDIYYEYLELEGQAWRKEILIRVVPFSLCLEDDPNYQEFIEWFRYRMFQEFMKGRYVFKPGWVNPRCWYHDGRKHRAIANKEEILKLRMEMQGHVEESETK